MYSTLLYCTVQCTMYIKHGVCIHIVFFIQWSWGLQPAEAGMFWMWFHLETNRCDWLIINSNPAYDLWTLKQRGCFMSDDKIWIELILRRIIHDDIADHASTNDILINAFQYYREKNWPLLYYGICCYSNCFEYDSFVSWNRNWIRLPEIRIRADSSVAVSIFS